MGRYIQSARVSENIHRIHIFCKLFFVHERKDTQTDTQQVTETLHNVYGDENETFYENR